MPDAVYWKKQDNIANIVFDDPGQKVNILSTPVMKRFSEILIEISKDTAIQGVLITSNKNGIFIAGADIKEVQYIATEEEGRKKAAGGQEIFNKLAGLRVPTVAVINGVALGGGFELALACRYRVAGFGDKVQIGLPEIRLGVIPGFGGTVRLPKIIGLMQALNMIPAGKIVGAKDALRIGLVDNLFPNTILLEESVKFLKQIIVNPIRTKQPKKIFLQRIPFGQKLIRYLAKKKTLEKTKGFYQAPIEAVNAICYGFGKSLDDALKHEAEVFGKLVATKTAKNLIHVFFLTEKYKHMDWGFPDIKPQIISKCGVVGAGVMGGAIAQLVTNRNIQVRMKDINLSAIGKGLETARKMYRFPLKTKKIKQHEVDIKMGLISGTTSYSGFGNTDIVIEAVVEDLKIKEKIFGELDKETRPSTILATNTSSLSVSKMASACKNPERVVGMHFFNPVDRMPLVEVIAGQKTSREAIAGVISFSRYLGKTPIVVKDRAGFLVNRLLLPYMNNAATILMEGNSIEHIDSALTDFGMPMGPLALADEVGIDVCYKVAKILEEAFGERMAVSRIIKDVVDLGLLGKKSGRGFYIYKGKKKKPNPKIYVLVKDKKTDPKEIIQKRLIQLMIDEAKLVLKEGIVDDPDTIDLGMIFGTGFPPFLGGLMKYAKDNGLLANS